MSTVPRERLGLAAGLQATMRNLGISGGAAAAAAIMASRYRAHGGGQLRTSGGQGFDSQAFAHASQDLYLALTGVALLALMIAGRASRAERG